MLGDNLKKLKDLKSVMRKEEIKTQKENTGSGKAKAIVSDYISSMGKHPSVDDNHQRWLDGVQFEDKAYDRAEAEEILSKLSNPNQESGQIKIGLGDV